MFVLKVSLGLDVAFTMGKRRRETEKEDGLTCGSYGRKILDKGTQGYSKISMVHR